MRYPKRKPMKQWIREKLDSNSYTGLRWIDKSRGKFEISWKHGSLETWSWEEDVHVFREWAIYTGKYRPHNRSLSQEDLELAKTWKTNFRCALNALPGLQIVKEESSARGTNARKVYIMKPTEKRKRKRKRKDEDAVEPEMTPWSTGIDQEAIDEMEKELSQCPAVLKKGFAMPDITNIQDFLHYQDELFNE